MKPLVNAGFEAAVSKEHQYDKTFHHSSGSLTSSVGASHLLWRPRGPKGASLLDANHVIQKPMKETAIGTLQIQVHSLQEAPVDIQNAYVRLGCLLPIGAQSGRWPRYHTKQLPNPKNKTDVTWNEGTKVAIVQFLDTDDDFIMFPQVTMSLRSKKVGWFGTSITLSKICTVAFDKLWNGPDNPWSSVIHIPMPNKSSTKPNLNITLFLKYTPKPTKEENANVCRAVEELARELALVSTYKDKVLMKPLKPDEIQEFTEQETVLRLKEESESADDIIPL